jgi:GATA-binding protein, other eukaryote
VPDTVAGSSSSSSVFGEAPPSGSPHSSRKFPSLFTDDLFAARKPTVNNGRYPSPVVSGSPDLKAAELAAEDVDPERLAKEDPLATQVWKMYAKTKATLPHGQRMENLTWRMMALALKKKKEDEERVKAEEKQPEIKQEKAAESIDAVSSSSAQPPGSSSTGSTDEDSERGRSKGKARVKVVGFDGTNQDGVEDVECVHLFHSDWIDLLIPLCRNPATYLWTGGP